MFECFATQVLGMKWLSELVYSVMKNTLNLNMQARMGQRSLLRL